jgi:hypothetical protein
VKQQDEDERKRDDEQRGRWIEDPDRVRDLLQQALPGSQRQQRARAEQPQERVALEQPPAANELEDPEQEDPGARDRDYLDAKLHQGPPGGRPKGSRACL